ncbi:DGQHR domain-containing protein [Xanthomonas sp. WHRI 10064A]|uniref:DGQHR domain-containing protein n=1 Tax=unclassified Xanthomonas TaxID=2643310 RepID=UPI002B2383CD|nr:MULTISPECIES: DGQHR domain-containing protein [unclassified Xanthomonas]MEA9589195.1 DGQHR domain-containing protein [Xanthomonas sp. WHRI 10064B]MEA9616882.1 DGQHR domain-containing protein [Xanthomonas sp. WHRI 10064A]
MTVSKTTKATKSSKTASSPRKVARKAASKVTDTSLTTVGSAEAVVAKRKASRQAQLILPSLRGNFGDWVYYTCLMSVKDIADRVNYAEEIHTDKALSRLIQRSLEGPRAKHIANYLTNTKDRFFSAMVLATYGGEPQWMDVGNFHSTSNPEIVNSLDEDSRDAMGFLALSGKEKIFAVDGQHRLAGIREAIREQADFEGEQLPVILIGHDEKNKRQRTRRLFTTLNKTAKPVKKRDIIALDEDDAMAIISRRLVEEHAWFKDPRIAVISSSNVPSSDTECLTTITNLYNVLRLLLLHHTKQKSDRTLRFFRPSDEVLEGYYKYSLTFFTALAKYFPPVKDAFTSNAENPVAKYRNEKGGHILFRPIGLLIVADLVTEYMTKHNVSLANAVKAVAVIPTDISKAPYKGVIWDADRGLINAKQKALARDVLSHMLGLNDGNSIALKARYAAALNKPGAALPAKLE